MRNKRGGQWNFCKGVLGQVNENTELLVRYRDNILTILNQMNSMTGVMQHMPPLPVRLNVELANNFLPKAGSGNLFPQGASILMAGQNPLYFAF